LNAQPGQIPARPRQRGDEAPAHGIGGPGKHDRDRLGGALRGAGRWRADGEDNVRFEADQFSGEARKDLVFSFGGTVLENNIPPFDPP